MSERGNAIAFDHPTLSRKTASLYPTSKVFPDRIVGALRLPVGPSIAATALAGGFPPTEKVVIFLPLATINVVIPLSNALASASCSLRLAGTVSVTLTLLASRNLEALEQLVQPLRK